MNKLKKTRSKKKMEKPKDRKRYIQEKKSNKKGVENDTAKEKEK
jgi:hypothetical protein